MASLAASPTPALSTRELAPDRLGEAVDVLSEAFHDYPVMRYVIGAAGDAYASRLRAMLTFFTSARFIQDELVTGAVTTDDVVVGVANSTLPGTQRSPAILGTEREAVWRELGADALARHEAYGSATAPFAVDRPNYHLAMLGVRRSHAGTGVARRLLDALHDTSRRDRDRPGSRSPQRTPATWRSTSISATRSSVILASRIRWNRGGFSAPIRSTDR